MINELNVVIKLFIALVLGLVSGGWQYRHKLKLLRSVVCMVACVLAVVSINYQAVYTVYNIDPGIIVSYIITGTSLLGAVLVMSGEPFTIELTNAVSLLSVAAIGMAVGYAYYVAAVCTTVISYATLIWFQESKKD